MFDISESSHFWEIAYIFTRKAPCHVTSTNEPNIIALGKTLKSSSFIYCGVSFWLLDVLNELLKPYKEIEAWYSRVVEAWFLSLLCCSSNSFWSGPWQHLSMFMWFLTLIRSVGRWTELHQHCSLGSLYLLFI